MDTTALTSSPKSRYSLIALLLFLLTFVGAVFYVRPLWDEVTSLSLGRNDKVSQKQNLEQQLSTLQELQQSLNVSSEVNKQTTLASIPEKLEQDKLIVDLTNIALKNDVVLNGVNFSISPSEIPGQVTRVAVNASLVGSESALVNFLRGVEANTRKLLVKSITVQLGDGNSALSRANFSVNMEAYYQGVI